MRKINLSRDAAKFLADMHPKHGRQVALKISLLAENPSPVDSRKLKGYDFFRVDAGEYRIVYKIKPEEVEILLVGKRNDDDVYKRLRRK